MQCEASVPRLRSSPRGQPRPSPTLPNSRRHEHDTGLTTSRPSATGGRRGDLPSLPDPNDLFRSANFGGNAGVKWVSNQQIKCSDIQHNSVLVDGSPQPVTLAADF